MYECLVGFGVCSSKLQFQHTEMNSKEARTQKTQSDRTSDMPITRSTHLKRSFTTQAPSVSKWHQQAANTMTTDHVLSSINPSEGNFSASIPTNADISWIILEVVRN